MQAARCDFVLGELMDKLLEDEGCLRGVVTCCLSCQLGCWASCHNPLVILSSNPSGDWSGELPAGCQVRPGAFRPTGAVVYCSG